MTTMVSAESYQGCVAEAAILNALHWIELYGTSGYRADHGGICDMERDGGFAYFTLRSENKSLAGHAGFMLINSPFYGKSIALDAFYNILPEFRGQYGMCKLLKFAARTMKQNGVDSVIVSHKTAANIRPIIERSGFVKTGETYTFTGEP